MLNRKILKLPVKKRPAALPAKEEMPPSTSSKVAVSEQPKSQPVDRHRPQNE
jgi:hypothetical protein